MYNYASQREVAITGEQTGPLLENNKLHLVPCDAASYEFHTVRTAQHIGEDFYFCKFLFFVFCFFPEELSSQSTLFTLLTPFFLIYIFILYICCAESSYFLFSTAVKQGGALEREAGSIAPVLMHSTKSVNAFSFL